jgi:glycyl-tRNA synthetase (class II)
MREMLIIDTVVIAFCMVLITVMGIVIFKLYRTKKEETTCEYRHETRCNSITTKSGIRVNCTLTQWYCSSCCNGENIIESSTKYCPHCGKKIVRMVKNDFDLM